MINKKEEEYIDVKALLKLTKHKMFPDEYANKLYKKGYYIEAFQILHSWIESRMTELLMLIGTEKYNSESKEIWDITFQIGYNNLAKVLLVLSQISKNEYQAIIKFNNTRNKLIHRIFLEYYEKPYKGILKKECDNIFKQGLKVAVNLFNKVEIFNEE